MLEGVAQIKQRNILLNTFYYLLSQGITDGITEEQFRNIVKQYSFRLKETGWKVEIPDENFISIIADANWFDSNGIELVNKSSGLNIAQATYELRKGNAPLQSKEILCDILNEAFVPSNDINDGVSLELDKDDNKLNMAKKIAAFYVNDLIERYVKAKIKFGNWPKQCANIDEFIFERDIASYINEEGTRHNFKLAYLNAIKVAYLLLNKEDMNLRFSNNRHLLLAYANYQQLFKQSDIEFLTAYSYNANKQRDIQMSVQLSNNAVVAEETRHMCMETDEGANHMYIVANHVIGDDVVAIMEKRIGGEITSILPVVIKDFSDKPKQKTINLNKKH